MSVLIVRGTVLWKVQRRADDDGNPIVVATCRLFKAVLWGNTNEELTDHINVAMDLAFAHLAKHDCLESFARRAGFSVDTHDIPLDRLGSDAPELRTVNGTFGVLQEAVA